MQPSDFVLKFLASIGRPSEAELYLSLFRADKRRFAIISVASSVLEDSPDAIIADLRFLGRLGLTPVVAMDAADADYATAIRERLAPDVRCELAATQEDAGAIAQAGAIPMVTIADPGELSPLAEHLMSRKVVLLGKASGLLPQAPDGAAPLSLVNLTTEYEALARPGVLSADQRAELDLARDLIATVPHRMTVTVTSPYDLLRELFTERGAGTLIRRGSEITRHARYADIDRERLGALLASAFGKPPNPALWERPPLAIYVADDYRGAAILTDTALGPYLSKFAASARARGEGIGRDLWQCIAGEHDTMFWRSRPENPITSWYMHHCHGMARAGRWRVFWRGLAEDLIADAIAYARAAPPDF